MRDSSARVFDNSDSGDNVSYFNHSRRFSTTTLSTEFGINNNFNSNNNSVINTIAGSSNDESGRTTVNTIRNIPIQVIGSNNIKDSKV